MGGIDNGSLTDQLNCGVRSFELDVSLRGESMTVCHNLLTESESYAPDVEGALKELKMWSDYNPQHLPVIVIMEFKNGISGQEEPTMEGILAFEELLYGVMGDKLFTPQDALGEYDSFAEFVAADAYPTSAETVGKFIFMLHATGNDADGQGIAPYLDLDRTMSSLGMFIANAGDWTYEAECVFVVRNDLDLDWVRATVERNLAENRFVRVQSDIYGARNEDRLAFALRAGANIISVDSLTGVREGLRVVCGESAAGKTMFLRGAASA